MRRVIVVLCAFVAALAVPLSAKMPGPPASATFAVDACVDTGSRQVTATITWTHARLDAIHFSAFGNGALLGGLDASGGGSRDGSVTRSWIPQLSPATAITNEIEVVLKDYKDRWTLVGHVPVFTC